MWEALAPGATLSSLYFVWPATRSKSSWRNPLSATCNISCWTLASLVQITYLNIGGGVVSHVVQVVLHHNVHTLHQVLVVDLHVYRALKIMLFSSEIAQFLKWFFLTCFDIKILAWPSSARAELARAVKIIGIRGDMMEVWKSDTAEKQTNLDKTQSCQQRLFKKAGGESVSNSSSVINQKY